MSYESVVPGLKVVADAEGCSWAVLDEAAARHVMSLCKKLGVPVPLVQVAPEAGMASVDGQKRMRLDPKSIGSATAIFGRLALDFLALHEVGHVLKPGHGHDFEFAADQFAVQALARLGHDTEEIVTAVDGMLGSEPASRSHPAGADRVRRVREVLGVGPEVTSPYIIDRRGPRR